MINAVDLFCGVGGLTHGLIKAGINVTAGIDIDSQCKYAFESNNSSRFIAKSVDEITGKELAKLFGKSKISLLAGCAPCQPFSRYSLAASNRMHPKWSLLDEFSRLVCEVRPTLITMENVPELERHDVFEFFTQQLKSNGYHIWHQVVDCQYYGVPQTRKRLVLLGSQLGDLVLKRPSTKKKTVKQVIGKLPPLSAGDSHTRDILHSAAELSELNIKRIRQSTPGGTWRDWDEHLVADCHRKESGKTFPAVYGRMAWDQPAPTMTTQFYGYGNGRFGHPTQDRAISLREGAIFQSFPKNYKFVEPGQPVHRKVIGRLIGNAVPPQLGKVIGQTLIEHVAKLS
jgi:DNA (cytosine-5)-methyltransferase 1